MKCLLCGHSVDDALTLRQLLGWSPIEDAQVCETCATRFEWINGHTCPGCGHPQPTTVLCSQCEMWQSTVGFLLTNQSLLHYNDALHDFMQRYKFVGDYRLRTVFANALETKIREQQADVVVPIPINPATWQTRGFNQVTGMLPTIGWQPLLTTRSQEKQQRQSQKNRAQRLATAQPFRLNEVVLNGTIQNKKVLLVDDVYTTGRTLYHAAQLLWDLKPATVRCITLAR